MKNITDVKHGSITNVKCFISFIDPDAIVSNKNNNAGKMAVHLIGHSNSNINVIAMSTGQLKNIAKEVGLASVPALIRTVNASQKQTEIEIDYIACREGEEFELYDGTGTDTYTKDWWRATDFTVTFPDVVQDILTKAQIDSAVELDRLSFTESITDSMSLGAKLRAKAAKQRADKATNLLTEKKEETPAEKKDEKVAEKAAK